MSRSIAAIRDELIGRRGDWTDSNGAQITAYQHSPYEVLGVRWLGDDGPVVIECLGLGGLLAPGQVAYLDRDEQGHVAHFGDSIEGDVSEFWPLRGGDSVSLPMSGSYYALYREVAMAEGIRIYDVLGNIKDADWLATTWGVVIDRSAVREDAASLGNWRITSLREVEGPSTYPHWVYRQDGTGYSGISVGRHWPDAGNGWPGGSHPDNVACPPEFWDRCIFGQTNAQGFVSFDFGDGDYAGPGDGANAFCIPIHYGGTEAIKRMGCLPNTNRRVLSVSWVWEPIGSEPDPDPDPDPEPEPEPDPVELDGCLARLIWLLTGKTLS
jgi:hypothetical protein